MRIGFFTDTYLPVRSGMEISIETFRIGLERLGHEVHVFAPTMHGYNDVNPNVVRFRSIRVLKNPEMRLASEWNSPNKSLKEIRAIKLDVVHAHSPFTMGLLGRHIARVQKIPFIFTNHTHHTEYTRVYFAGLFFPKMMEKWIRWFSNQADEVIVPSYKFQKVLEEYGVRSPIEILQTGINVDRFKKTSEALEAAKQLRAKYNIPEDAPILLYVGRMSEEKNISYLVNAIGALARTRPDVYMFFVGNGQHIDVYQAQAQKLGFKNAIFTGVIKPENIVPYYHSASAFIFASLTDTQGIVILEAMACGMPVVALEDNAFKEVINNGQNGFLIPNNAAPELFANKIAEVLEKKPEYAHLGEHALLTAQQFTEMAQAQKLVSLYESLIAKKKAGAGASTQPTVVASGNPATSL